MKVTKISQMPHPIQLSELVTEVKPGFAIGERDPEGVIQIRMNNVDIEGNLDLLDVIRVPASDKQTSDCSVKFGDVLFNNTNSTELVGKSTVFRGHNEPVTFSNHFTRFRVHPDRLNPIYLARWLTYQQRIGVFERLCSRWVGQSAVRSERVLALAIPLPSLSEQTRIADILDKADAIRRKRKNTSIITQELAFAAFRETFKGFLRPEETSTVLSGVAIVASGVAKGRKMNGANVREVPYLRVANVQAGHLDLSEIKTIPATESEIKFLALQHGDVVMTEGGDFDKLGRGALWDHEVPDCIHQNHVFRVRTDPKQLLPTFFVHYLQLETVKAYFLRCAKKTTNLASINMTQLRALPVPLPPLSMQQRFDDELRSINKITQREAIANEAANDLFHSLVQRAFNGEL